MKTINLSFLPLLVIGTMIVSQSLAQAPSDPANLPHHDGSRDFDFLIENWKAHVRRLPDRLNNSNIWVEYDGISNHKKILDSNANICAHGAVFFTRWRKDLGSQLDLRAFALRASPPPAASAIFCAPKLVQKECAADTNA